jgi:hypothetical protein
MEVWPARLETDGGLHFWVVQPCPRCGDRHVFAAGLAGGDPKRYLGVHPAPCAPGVRVFLVRAELQHARAY